MKQMWEQKKVNLIFGHFWEWKWSSGYNVSFSFQFYQGQIGNTYFSFSPFFGLNLGPQNTNEKHFKVWKLNLGYNVSFGFQFQQNQIKGGFFEFLLYEFEHGTSERQWEAFWEWRWL